jgi:hypothetical protein
MTDRPSDAEFAPFFAGYVSLVPESDIVAVLQDQTAHVRRHALAFSGDRESFRYAAGKWSAREVFGHIGDAERVFGYRAFCISRGEEANLPGFDEQQYVAHSSFDGCRLADLVEEFGQMRESNLIVLRRLDAAAWLRSGSANGSPVSVRALAFIMAGHVRHHLQVLSTRYAARNEA